ncbi:unnamed protein product [Urochloa humidicola]
MASLLPRTHTHRGMELRSHTARCSTGPSSSSTKIGTCPLLLRHCRGCRRGGADGRLMLLLRPCSSRVRRPLRFEEGKGDARELAGEREGRPCSSANAPLPRFRVGWGEGGADRTHTAAQAAPPPADRGWPWRAPPSRAQADSQRRGGRRRSCQSATPLLLRARRRGAREASPASGRSSAGRREDSGTGREMWTERRKAFTRVAPTVSGWGFVDGEATGETNPSGRRGHGWLR